MSQRYLLNVDWLAVYGLHALPIEMPKFDPWVYHSDNNLDEERVDPEHPRLTEQDAKNAANMCLHHFAGAWHLEEQSYGTKQFSTMFHVYLHDEHFAFLQVFPRTSTMPRNSFILKVVNKWLYTDKWLHYFTQCCDVLHLRPRSISRLDIAADFERFAYGAHPLDFIRDFMSGQIKHKGRGAGHVDFRQRYAPIQKGARKDDYLLFNALTMGKKTSDAHCYLYNKSLELKEVEMKPWIVECWQRAGFDTENVWRLEVTCGSKALKCYDRNTGDMVEMTVADLFAPTFPVKLRTFYLLLIKSLFFFFRPNGQKNVTRQTMLQLFGDSVDIDRHLPDNMNPSDRTERILIRQLYSLTRRYRGLDNGDLFASQFAARKLAASMKLTDWMRDHESQWDKTKLK